MQDNVMHLFVKGAGATKPRVWSGMRGTNQALLTLERMSSKCSRDVAAESPFVVGTNNVVTYNLLANLAGQKYGMLGQGASLWECQGKESGTPRGTLTMPRTSAKC